MTTLRSVPPVDAAIATDALRHAEARPPTTGEIVERNLEEGLHGLPSEHDRAFDLPTPQGHASTAILAQWERIAKIHAEQRSLFLVLVAAHGRALPQDRPALRRRARKAGDVLLAIAGQLAGLREAFALVIDAEERVMQR